MPDLDAVIKSLFGADPLIAEHAVSVLAQERPQLIERVLPLSGAAMPSPSGPAADMRLARLAQAWGDAIVPHLERCLRKGAWATKLATPPFFGGLAGSDDAVKALIAVLRDGNDFDAERMAIASFGWLGADGWAWSIDHHVRKGAWERREHDTDDVSSYPYGKLWSYGIEAVARMAAQAATTDRVRSMFRLLDDALRLQRKEKPNVSPSGVDMVERVEHLFGERHIDALLAQWRESSDDGLRTLYLDLLGTVAPLRAAGQLLEVMTSPSEPAAIRRAASIAMGEIRTGEACRRFSKAFTGRDIDAECAWAASALYVAGGSWSEHEAFYGQLMDSASEPGAQFRFAMAVRGDGRCRDRLESDLDAADPYLRWAAALALARLLGAQSLSLLRFRLDEAGDDLERSALLAAAVRAGAVELADDLHAALQRVSLRRLRSLWRQEIVAALRCGSDGERRYDAWCRELLINERHRRYFDSWNAGAAPALNAAMQRSAPAPAIPSATALPRQPVDTSLTAAPEPQQPQRVFISYSHHDKRWLQRFQEMQTPLSRAGKLQLWDDTRMQPGQWRPQIDAAMRDADAALFLVSTHFLESDFVHRHELPDLLHMAQARGLRIIWVLLDACFWEVTELAKYQGVNADKPLAQMRSKADRQTVIKRAWSEALGLRL